MQRQTPEQILKKFEVKAKEEEKNKFAKLKIFLGYAAGSGKTYAMLSEARNLLQNGVDVVLGYIEPHDRPETMSLTEGFESIENLEISYKNITLKEFDLDATLKRKPALVLVDELAHTNAKGLRNEKRFQDIEELLKAGIDVYTTLNIQHLESLNDLVANISKIEVKERIPDRIFDEADQVELVDIEPNKLLKRMQEGKIYKEKQAKLALENFFRQERLVALREIALRRLASRVNLRANEQRLINDDLTYHTGEHILVCINESNAKVIRSAARLASAFHAKLSAICIKNSNLEEDKSLKENLELAKSFDAEIISVYDEDVAGQIAEYSSISNVSKIVLGKNKNKKKFKEEIFEAVAKKSPNIDLYLVNESEIKMPKMTRKKGFNFLNFIMINTILLLAIIIAFIFHQFDTQPSNIVMVFILAVFSSSFISDNKFYALYSSLISVLFYNFFFLKPFFSFKIHDSANIITFATMFIVGFLTSVFTRRLKLQSKELAKRSYRTAILLENSEKLARVKSKQELWEQLGNQALKLLNLPIIIYPMSKNNILSKPLLFFNNDKQILKNCFSADEIAIAQWVATNRERAGLCTNTLPNANAMYLPIEDGEKTKGVIGIVLKEKRPLQDFQYEILNALINEVGVRTRDIFLL
ncbi:sensor histidine kinase KdpD [Campylobacter sp. W0018]|uniref:sensor histidine kinase n=1 Tax=unclassified Campylobacter TaxID=2593542 RepID=UPI001EB76261|nr:sensor histidine kinase KdpD [Campylobacter sp. W0014]MBZ7954146.1 sensor histidine kinase KdpD [Campylobacter sp. W0018]